MFDGSSVMRARVCACVCVCVRARECQPRRVRISTKGWKTRWVILSSNTPNKCQTNVK
jgi:hypothetical protein